MTGARITTGAPSGMATLPMRLTSLSAQQYGELRRRIGRKTASRGGRAARSSRHRWRSCFAAQAFRSEEYLCRVRATRCLVGEPGRTPSPVVVPFHEVSDHDRREPMFAFAPRTGGLPGRWRPRPTRRVAWHRCGNLASTA
jgi:hypothetical protein